MVGRFFNHGLLSNCLHDARLAGTQARGSQGLRQQHTDAAFFVPMPQTSGSTQGHPASVMCCWGTENVFVKIVCQVVRDVHTGNARIGTMKERSNVCLQGH